MLCSFPAAQLLKYRRELSILAEGMDPESQQLHDAMGSCLAIDQLRILHEGITGCQCWYEAIGADAKKPLSGLVAR